MCSSAHAHYDWTVSGQVNPQNKGRGTAKRVQPTVRVTWKTLPWCTPPSGSGELQVSTWPTHKAIAPNRCATAQRFGAGDLIWRFNVLKICKLVETKSKLMKMTNLEFTKLKNGPNNRITICFLNLQDYQFYNPCFRRCWTICVPKLDVVQIQSIDWFIDWLSDWFLHW